MNGEDPLLIAVLLDIRDALVKRNEIERLKAGIYGPETDVMKLPSGSMESPENLEAPTVSHNLSLDEMFPHTSNYKPTGNISIGEKSQ